MYKVLNAREPDIAVCKLQMCGQACKHNLPNYISAFKIVIGFLKSMIAKPGTFNFNFLIVPVAQPIALSIFL